MLPEAKNDDLLYVGGNNEEVTVYSYPKGKLVGTIKNNDFYLPSGECVDAAGDVFITNLGNDYILEYSHGSKKVKETLQAPSVGTAGCAVDPTTGDLAVTIFGGASSGYVAVYPNASGTPTTYSDPDIYYYYYCGYDNNGNLFVDGQAHNPKPFELAELPQGSGSMSTITLNQKVDWPGGVQWDGTYLTVDDQTANAIYQFTITGSGGTLEGMTPLDGADDVHQPWIDGKRVVGGDHTDSEVQYWRYPAGGNPTKTITKGVGGPDGLTISKAKN